MKNKKPSKPIQLYVTVKIFNQIHFINTRKTEIE